MTGDFKAEYTLRKTRTGRWACLFCLAPEAMEVRWDVRGLPYCICVGGPKGGCGARAFLRGPVSFRGIFFIDDFVAQCSDITAVQQTIDQAGRSLAPIVSVPAEAPGTKTPAPKVERA